MTSKPKVEEAAKAAETSDSEEGAGASLSMEGLRRYLAEKLHITDSKHVNKHAILKEFSVDEIAALIRSDKCKNIITLAGAGISTSAGIPDFRSPGSGLYDNLQKYNLPCPQAIFELDFFQDNPKPFFVLAKELYPGSFKPTPCHYFIKLLEQKGLLLRHYTQNIDTLERVAGISDEKLVEAHGTFYTGHCMLCRNKYSLSWMKDLIFADEIPICEKCPGIVKPDIVFFGENLPDKFYKCADEDFKKCDLLIIMGSSLVVQPFASLVDRVSDKTPRLLINREKVGQNGGIMAMIGIGGGLEYDSSNNTRDVAWLGDCDEGCQLLAEKLEWGQDLRKMIDEEHKRIDQEQGSEQKKSSEETAKTSEKKLPKKDSSEKLPKKNPPETKTIEQEELKKN